MDTKAKHTPGPWRHHEMEPLTIVAGKPGICIADCSAISRTDEENQANARLIASAPLGLDLAEMVLELPIMVIDDTVAEMPVTKWREFVSKARELKSKAEGK